MKASTYLRMSAVRGRFGTCTEFRIVAGESGELTAGCEYFLCWPPKTDGSDKLASSAWRVESVIESVATDVTELCLALPFMEEDDMLGLSEP